MMRDPNCMDFRQAVALLAKIRAAGQMCYETTPQWATFLYLCIPSGSSVMLISTESRICQGIDLCAVNGQRDAESPIHWSLLDRRGRSGFQIPFLSARFGPLLGDR